MVPLTVLVLLHLKEIDSLVQVGFAVINMTGIFSKNDLIALDLTKKLCENSARKYMIKKCSHPFGS